MSSRTVPAYIYFFNVHHQTPFHYICYMKLVHFDRCSYVQHLHHTCYTMNCTIFSHDIPSCVFSIPFQVYTIDHNRYKGNLNKSMKYFPSLDLCSCASSTHSCSFIHFNNAFMLLLQRFVFKHLLIILLKLRAISEFYLKPANSLD